MGYSAGMNRATLKVPPITAERLAKLKWPLSAAAGRRLTTGEAIDYLAKYWLDATGKPQLYTAGPDGRPYGQADA